MNPVSKNRPNIILMVTDATRPDHLSCYGHHRMTTPHIDQIAAEGVLYEQAISPAAWTLPSHASMFTGLHVSQHGTHFKHQYLDPRFLTVAEMLRQQGYRTAGLSASWVSEAFGLHRGFETFQSVKRLIEGLRHIFKQEILLEKVLRRIIEKYRSLSHRTNRLSKQWLTKQINDESPFFLFLLYTDPHLPYRFREPYASRYLGKLKAQAKRVNQDPHKYMAGRAEMSEEDFEILRLFYDVQLSSLDDIVGEFLGFLQHKGILDNTLLVFTSDHGENIGDHGLMAHQYCVYDSLIHVPLIIRYPPLLPAGQRVYGQVQTSEIFTTIMSILGIEKEDVPNDVRGRSLVPTEVASNPLPFTIAEYLAPNMRRMLRLWPDGDYSRYDRQLRALRQDDYKYIWLSDGQHELYDLKADPEELHNLIDSEPEKAQELETRLEEWLASLEPPQFEAELEPEIEDVLRERLEGLGYL